MKRENIPKIPAAFIAAIALLMMRSAEGRVIPQGGTWTVKKLTNEKISNSY